MRGAEVEGITAFRNTCIRSSAQKTGPAWTNLSVRQHSLTKQLYAPSNVLGGGNVPMNQLSTLGSGMLLSSSCSPLNCPERRPRSRCHMGELNRPPLPPSIQRWLSPGRRGGGLLGRARLDR